MKKTFLVGTAISALLAIPVQAADLPVKAPPRAAVTTSWAGFYVGAHAGYGYAVSALSFADFDLDERVIGAGSKGFVAGALAGYNVMLSPRWVGGIEVDGNWQNIKTKVNVGGGGKFEMALDWSASVRGRIGYLMTPTTMLFGTFGWSWSEVEFSNNIVPESFSRSVSGPQVGFGTETMYTANWIIRSEYLHSFYNRAGFSSEVIGRLSASPWVGVIRTAIIYKPGPSAPTAWPDRAPTPIWSGLYVGGLVGPLVASGKLKVPEVGFTGDGVGVSAVVPTALVGYNVLIAPHWLVGVEGEIAPNISTSDIKIEWTGAARVRAGILLTPTVLAYGNVGWGTAGVDNVTRREGSFSIHIERVHAFGWGTGLEAAVSDRWRLRADYQYYVTNKLNLFFPFEGGITGSVRATSQTARLGAIYQLSGP